jgi:succinate dehydrogenase flavin-adding protein (antitoxin of CptAB toxin-antitoxin module)
MNDTSLMTLNWINKQLDELNGKSKLIGEMLMEENDTHLIKILDKKLQELEAEHKSLYKKLLQEKEIIKDKFGLTDNDFHSY